MKFVIIGLLCSPFLENCLPFESEEEFKNKIICEREIKVAGRKIAKQFEIDGFPAKIYLKCKEKKNGISS